MSDIKNMVTEEDETGLKNILKKITNMKNIDDLMNKLRFNKYIHPMTLVNLPISYYAKIAAFFLSALFIGKRVYDQENNVDECFAQMNRIMSTYIYTYIKFNDLSIITLESNLDIYIEELVEYCDKVNDPENKESVFCN